jgi:hypothetical protein
MPRDVGLKTDRLAEAHHIQLLQDRFAEVKDDDAFLERIASNARQY